MNDDLKRLIELAHRKYAIDQKSGWSSGAETYLKALKDEIDEVLSELTLRRPQHLQDELGDLLWNLVNALVVVSNKDAISIESVFDCAANKYSERITGIENGDSWKDIKARQLARLESGK